MSGFCVGKDNYYIYSQDSALDYLQLVGLSKEDFLRIAGIIDPFFAEWRENQDNFIQKDEVDDWECVADGYLQSYNNMCDDIEAECEKFLSGRKITKSMFVNWLKSKLEDGLYEY